jgi:hypothetical protein
MTALVSDTVIAGAPDDCQLLEPLNCAELACYVDLRPALDRVWIAYLHLHCVSLHLITPFLRCNGLVPALVAVEVESYERRGVRRDWRSLSRRRSREAASR